MDHALDFIEDNNLIPPERLNYISYITGYFVFRKGTELNTTQTDTLKSWYENVKFSNLSNGKRRILFDSLLLI